MLNANVRINKINYENTIQRIFPVVSPKVMTISSSKVIVRLFRQLGDAALPVLLGVTSRLPENTKNELLIRGLNAYAPILKEQINTELHKDEWGQCFTIGTISVSQRENILLNLGRIEVNYQELLKREQISEAMSNRFGKWKGLAKTAASLAVTFAQNTVERKGLDWLLQENNQKKLLGLIRQILDKYDIQIDVDDIQIVQENAKDVLEVPDSFSLTEQMENDMIAALAGYLRDNVAKGCMVSK